MTHAEKEQRTQRKEELLRMWSDRRGQLKVLNLAHQALPPGQSLHAGMNIFELILNAEFDDGAPSSGN